MSLKEDMDALERAIDAGKGREWLRGTYTNPPEPDPADPSARPGLPDYRWITERGD
ncbi:MAG: hypothetical protein RI571_06470 [Roseovarius sp.]|nr:hypothetical protein [Roseovarius sp.]